MSEIPSVLAQGADRLNCSSAFLRKAVKWVAELPPDIRAELLEAARFPFAATPRTVREEP